MKIKLPSLPFWARSPQYRRTINRRLEPSTWTSPLKIDARHRAEREYLRNDFTPGPCYLPPDAPRQARRWRWERDPAVIGSVIGFFVVGIALYLLGGL